MSISTYHLPPAIRRLAMLLGVCLLVSVAAPSLTASDLPKPISELIQRTCFDCHAGASAEGGLDLTSLTFDLADGRLRECWILIHDRVKSGEMPPDRSSLTDGERQSMERRLYDLVAKADRDDVMANGRGPLRRLTRDEYEQNLRDVLQLPLLDIRHHQPADPACWRRLQARPAPPLPQRSQQTAVQPVRHHAAATRY